VSAKSKKRRTADARRPSTASASDRTKAPAPPTVARNGSENETAAPLDDLDPRHLRAIALFVEGGTVDEVARELGIGRSTLFRWRASPVFAAALADGLRAGLEAARQRLATMRERALDRLDRLVDDDTVPPAVAARVIAEILDRCGLAAPTRPAAEQVPAGAPPSANDNLDAVVRFLVDNHADRLREALASAGACEGNA